MKNRKRNRMKGFDYASNNLYFVTNCVKKNICCLGGIFPVGTGRYLSVHHPEKNHPEKNHPENQSFILRQDKNAIMQLNPFGEIVKNQILWLANQYPYVQIHNYIVMPNHFHIILEINSVAINHENIKIKSVSGLMGALKTTTSKLIHIAGFVDFAWHRSFHDHIIRNDKEYFYISNYIDNNPQKWLLDKFYNKF